MSDPIVTPPAAPAAPAAPPEAVTPPVAPEQTAAPTAPAAPAAPAQPDPWTDPVAARTEIERLRRENAADRTNAKTAAADEARTALAQQIGKALGLVADDTPVDPAKLTEQLTSTQAEAKAAKLELAIYRAAGTKFDTSALLDSRSFLEQVSTIDPTDTAALEAAIATATTANPRLKVTQAATVGGADLTGGTGQARTYTREQLADPAFYQANKTDILAAYSEGRITA